MRISLIGLPNRETFASLGLALSKFVMSGAKCADSRRLVGGEFRLSPLFLQI